MHNVLLGVFKTMMKIWIEGRDHAYKFSTEQKAEVNRRLKWIKPQLCSDFQRKPRTIEEFSRFKATEFRQLLLYTGPLIFKNVMDEPFYGHFLKLSVAIRILCHPVLYIANNDVASNLLEAFAIEFIQLYGVSYFVHNFHVITHLAKDALDHGPLDDFSAFPFESYLQQMLKSIKDAPNPLLQFKNRLGEQMKYSSTKTATVSKKRAKHSVVTERHVTITDFGNDCYVHFERKVLMVKEIRQNTNELVCAEVKDLIHFFTEPLQSKGIGMYCSDKRVISEDRYIVPANMALKIQALELDSLFTYTLILHSDF
ncbi:uncharacterized protein LOC129740380 [Uranotaenia lowii]|uniref:uncharacterized protein LOC129740380 n=1 Tax=Uranotaenia lowii TaxID=190385 RepID=UPI00247908EB|nr:uncharacterized protein LOC129740380 [Uranotaenia lowii]XP_055588012.1 uncharacterized protein LOC129740380 [Uranotaenia lowii]